MEQATADHAQMPSPTQVPSHPIVIYVTNKSDEPKSNIELFSPCKNMGNKWFTEDGCLIIGGYRKGIIIESGYGVVPYSMMLSCVAIQPMTVGVVYVNPFSNDAQIDKELGDMTGIRLSLTDINIDGTQLAIPINFVKPEGAVQNVFLYEDEIKIDGGTSIVIREMPPKTTFQFFFYPASVAKEEKSLMEEFGVPAEMQDQVIRVVPIIEEEPTKEQE